MTGPDLSRRILQTLATVLVIMVSPGMIADTYAATVTSVTQYGITWTFDKPYEAGQFVNGDWWVKGPVTITDIDPKTDAAGDTADGSMLNPVPMQPQGFRASAVAPVYRADLNISLQLPYTVAAGNSVVSTIKNPDTWATVDPEKTYFKEAAVLTVLGAAPPAGSFRPPYAGTDKTIRANWNVSGLNYGVLGKLAPPVPVNVPDRAWMEWATQRPLLEMHWNYLNSNWKASWMEDKPGGYPRRTYGREISHISSGAGLYLQTDAGDSLKEQLLINMCQWGIDIYGLLNAGMRWAPNGGHNHGRLLPLYLAARVLGDAGMLARCTPAQSGFQEFGQHWFVTQTDIDTPRDPETLTPYDQSQLGMPEWSSGGAYERDQADADFWKAISYRWINGAPNCGLAATVLLMNGRAHISHEPLMRYIIERHYPATKGGAAHVLPDYGDNPTKFTRDMWDTYVDSVLARQTAPPVISPPGGSYPDSVSVSMTCATDSAQIRYTIDGSEPTAAAGLYTGPFILTGSAVVRAQAFKTGRTPSGAVAAAITVILPPVEVPVITPAGGKFVDSVTVSIACSTAGAGVYYTVDGSDPAASGILYTAPFTLRSDAVVRARAVKTGYEARTAEAVFDRVLVMYDAAADFSDTQGYRGWTYRTSDGLMTFTGTEWKGGEQYLLLSRNGGHPGNNGDAVRRWTSELDGPVVISGTAADLNGATGDGVLVSILKNGEVLWQDNVANGDLAGKPFEVSTVVAVGDLLDFVINGRANIQCDMTLFAPVIVQDDPSGISADRLLPAFDRAVMTVRPHPLSAARHAGFTVTGVRAGSTVSLRALDGALTAQQVADGRTLWFGSAGLLPGIYALCTDGRVVRQVLIIP